MIWACGDKKLGLFRKQIAREGEERKAKEEGGGQFDSSGERNCQESAWLSGMDAKVIAR